MNEFDVIEQYFNREGIASFSTLVPNGDDCAVLNDWLTDERLAVSVDTCIEGVHFFSQATPEQIAKRALRTALSDLAAMGARPLAVTLALSLPRIDESWLSQFSKSFYQDLAFFNCELIGGDTTKMTTAKNEVAPIVITIQVMGLVDAQQILTRSAAQEGDGIYVTNTIGNGAAALFYLEALQDQSVPVGLDNSVHGYALDSFYAPMLAFDEMQSIKHIASSAIDISDGLFADLEHICNNSQVSAAIDLDALPFSDQALQLAKAHENDRSGEAIFSCLFNWALFGGDDYQLCFTASKKAMRPVLSRYNHLYTHIGDIVSANRAPRITMSSERFAGFTPSKASGYQHFS